MFLTISLIDVSRPPGVSSSMTTASRFCSLALLMLLPIYSADAGFITPLTVSTSTSFFAPEKKAALRGKETGKLKGQVFSLT